MKLEGHTVLITGGGTGIGAGLAGEFHRAGSKVIICGRREAVLRKTAEAHPGMEYLVLDVRDLSAVKVCAKKVEAGHPDLDVVINNAGVQKPVDFLDGGATTGNIDIVVDTNLKGPAYVGATFLPLLMRQKSSWLVNVSSGLMYVPLSFMPVYCATKAAVHSLTLSMRHQLRKTPVRVVELVPPAVKTALGGGEEDHGHDEMPLDKFIGLAVAGLRSGKDEVVVGGSRRLKWGSRILPSVFFGFLNPR